MVTLMVFFSLTCAAGAAASIPIYEYVRARRDGAGHHEAATVVAYLIRNDIIIGDMLGWGVAGAALGLIATIPIIALSTHV